MGSLMSLTITREHGRMELLAYEEAGTVQLFLENVSREGEHWLILSSEDGYPVIGYLRLSPTADPHIFEVAEVRPATGPLLPSPDDSPVPEALSYSCPSFSTR